MQNEKETGEMRSRFPAAPFCIYHLSFCLYHSFASKWSLNRQSAITAARPESAITRRSAPSRKRRFPGWPGCARKSWRHWLQPSDVILEYGAGFGWNLARLECRRKLAFDLADFLAPSIRAAGVEFVPDTKVIPVASVNVVVCHHALEHVMQPAAVLAEIGRLLRPDGKLLLFVPYERERKYRRFDRTEANHHLYSWNVQTLGNLVEESGFRVAEAMTGPFGYDRFAAVWAGKWRLGESGFRGLRQLLHLIKPAREVRIVATPTAKQN